MVTEAGLSKFNEPHSSTSLARVALKNARRIWMSPSLQALNEKNKKVLVIHKSFNLTNIFIKHSKFYFCLYNYSMQLNSFEFWMSRVWTQRQVLWRISIHELEIAQVSVKFLLEN